MGNGFLGIDLKNRTAEFWDNGDVKFSGTALATAGVAVARILQEPEKFKNRFLYVSDWTVSQRDVVRVLEKVSGERWVEKSVRGEERVREGKERLEKGDQNGVFELVKSAFLVEGLKTNFERDERLANEELGLPVLELEELVRGVLGK